MAKRLPRPFGRRSALVIVDVQNDFCPPNGSLAVDDGLATIPIINNLRAKIGWDLVVCTKDFHPKGHCSFLSTQLAAGRSAEKNKYHTLANGEEQMMWPDHCVQGTPGADLHKDLVTSDDDKIVHKGMDAEVENYSGFCSTDGLSTDGLKNTEMAKLLRQAHVTDVYVAGLAYDYCAGSTAVDAVGAGFTTYLVEDATRGVSPEGVAAMKIRCEKAGVRLITSKVMLEQLNSKEDRRSQAANYMDEHNIPLLCQKLCTALVYHKPDEPKPFLVKELQKLQKQRRSEMSQLSLLTDEDLDTMFHMLDPIGKGLLDGRQVTKALAGLGLTSKDIKDTDTFNVTKFIQLVLTASGSG